VIPLAPPYPLILERLRRGRAIPFLGAGASLGGRRPEETWAEHGSTCLPTGGELARYLAARSGFPAEEVPDLTKVAQYFDVVGGRMALHEELHGIFDRDFPLTPLHTFLAGLPSPLLLVTTNYDDLIERALQGAGRAYEVVVHTVTSAAGDRLLWWPAGATEPESVSPNRLDANLEEHFIVYKMHGAIDRANPERDQYVITEDDYVDFLARMTRNKAVPAAFAEPFQVRHFLFLGYGLRDWNLRVVLNRIERDLRRPRGIRSWAIQYRPSPLEQRFWQQRGVELYDLTIDEFVTALQAGAGSP
jgi:hypothetical protein